MRTVIAVTAGLMSLGIAGMTPAGAFSISPNGNFKANGHTSATKGVNTLPCIAHFKGHVTGGVGFVDSATFKDDGAVGCTAVTLSNTPWEADATGKKTVVIHNVTFSTPVGDCGPGDLPVTVRNGKITFTNAPLPPDCTVSGTLKTKPALSIVP